MDVCGAVKAARRTEDENMPSSRCSKCILGGGECGLLNSLVLREVGDALAATAAPPLNITCLGSGTYLSLEILIIKIVKFSRIDPKLVQTEAV